MSRERDGHKAALPRRILLELLDHQTLAMLRWDLHLLRVRISNLFLLKRRALAARVKRAPSPIFLNLGSGPRGKADPNWINIDAVRYPTVHYLTDFNRPLPFEENSFDGIYSEHVLEHFTLEQGQALLGDCLRILKPEGCIRLIVPDGRTITEWYLHAPERLLKHRPSPAFASPMGSLNSYFRQRYEHRFIYDAALLTTILSALGYEGAVEVSFGKGSMAELRVMDDAKYEEESLFVEAFKPNPLRTPA